MKLSKVWVHLMLKRDLLKLEQRFSQKKFFYRHFMRSGQVRPNMDHQKVINIQTHVHIRKLLAV